MSLSLKLCVGFPKLAKVKILSNGIFGCVFFFFAHEEDNRYLYCSEGPRTDLGKGLCQHHRCMSLVQGKGLILELPKSAFS